ncbi:dimethyladenosine transferase 1, mitochondrial-like [Entelurus aequoreus]|uniref:dimethyladenosine transferase 1, mitochondrial-like n=1 Tax=Entelurus aequoreus TaxID=161455 RepID=UPI002B1DBC8A|nr:dimethyladenosine transferase 1, mitochondrial-like [Entelurus aequoreus]
MLFPEASRDALTEEMMHKADVTPTLRPTELTIPHIKALADVYAHMCARDPHLIGFEFRDELRLKHLSRRERSADAERDGGEPPATAVKRTKRETSSR